MRILDLHLYEFELVRISPHGYQSLDQIYKDNWSNRSWLVSELLGPTEVTRVNSGYATYIIENDKRFGRLKQVLSRDNPAFRSCLANLTGLAKVEMHSDFGKCPYGSAIGQYLEKYHKARHPSAFQQRLEYRSMIFRLLLESRPAPPNIFSHEGTVLLTKCLPECGDDVTSLSTSVTQWKRLTLVSMTQVAQVDDSQVNAPQIDMDTVLTRVQKAYCLCLWNHRLNVNDRAVQKLCQNIFHGWVTPVSLKRIDLGFVYLSLELLGKFLTKGLFRPFKPFFVLSMTNVRAEDKTGWQPFLMLLKMTYDNLTTSSWRIQRIPNP